MFGSFTSPGIPRSRSFSKERKTSSVHLGSPWSEKGFGQCFVPQTLCAYLSPCASSRLTSHNENGTRPVVSRFGTGDPCADNVGEPLWLKDSVVIIYTGLHKSEFHETCDLQLKWLLFSLRRLKLLSTSRMAKQTEVSSSPLGICT